MRGELANYELWIGYELQACASGVVIKVSLNELRKLEAEGKIRIYTLEDVESIVGGKKGKNAAKSMRNNNEVLIEGNIPTSLIQRCN